MRTLLGVLLAFVALSAASCMPVVEAQSFPITLLALWDPPTQDTDGAPIAVDHYTFTLDNGVPSNVPPAPTGSTSTPFTISTKGSHTISVTAVTSLGFQSSPATLTFSASVPKAVTNIQLKKTGS